MDAFEFQTQIRNFADYPVDLGPFYTVLGLQEEVGKLSEKLRTSLKDNNGTFSDRDLQRLQISMGDILYYIVRMCIDMGIELNDVLDICLKKQNLLKQKSVNEKLDKNNIKHT